MDQDTDGQAGAGRVADRRRTRRTAEPAQQPHRADAPGRAGRRRGSGAPVRRCGHRGGRSAAPGSLQLVRGERIHPPGWRGTDPAGPPAVGDRSTGRSGRVDRSVRERVHGSWRVTYPASELDRQKPGRATTRAVGSPFHGSRPRPRRDPQTRRCRGRRRGRGPGRPAAAGRRRPGGRGARSRPAR